MTIMIAKCPSCLTVFELDPAKVPIEGVRARCSICSAVIVVPPASAARGPTVTPRVKHPQAEYSQRESVHAQSESAQSELPQTDPLQATPLHTESSPTAESRDTHSTTRPVEAPRRKPVNPFLTRDPSVRAQRLARALVSDIVAYYPERHAEALRDGTLKTTFRDEIQKSFEEYIGQVGREFAESTTYFQEALNDVLAGGSRQF